MGVLGIWHSLEPHILEYFIKIELAETLNESELKFFIKTVPTAAAGLIPIDPKIATAVEVYNNIQSTSKAALSVLFIILIVVCGSWSLHYVKTNFNARHYVESFIEKILLLCSAIAVLTTVGIVLSVLFESLRFFPIRIPDRVSIRHSLESANCYSCGSGRLKRGIRCCTIIYRHLTNHRYRYAGRGTYRINVRTISVGIRTSHNTATIIKPMLEILAGIPTVVYGFFAALAVAPTIRQGGETLGLSVSSESALAAGITMGIMLIPFISSLSDDVINAVPNSLREGSYGLGATRSETIVKVILPAALPGIIGSILLAVSRAIGETMIVVMAAGFAANLTANPLDSVTTVTVQIVGLLKGDQEFDSAKTLAAFALGLSLFFITLLLNILALSVVRKYREKYE